jgi:hypothetical protein
MRTRTLVPLLVLLLLVFATDAGARTADKGGAADSAASSESDVKPGHGPHSADPAKPEKGDARGGQPTADATTVEGVPASTPPGDAVVPSAPATEAVAAAPVATPDVTAPVTPAPTSAAARVRSRPVKARPLDTRSSRRHPLTKPVVKPREHQTRTSVARSSPSRRSIRTLSTPTVAVAAGGRQRPVVEVSTGGRELASSEPAIVLSPVPTHLALVDVREPAGAPNGALRGHLLAVAIGVLALGELLLVGLLLSRSRGAPHGEHAPAEL